MVNRDERVQVRNRELSLIIKPEPRYPIQPVEGWSDIVSNLKEDAETETWETLLILKVREKGGQTVRPVTVKAQISFAALTVLTFMAFVPSAGANPSHTMHPTPGRSSVGVTRLCGPAANYRCTGGGYAGKSEGWPGRLYGRGYASANQYGLHNCTLYAAYRLWKNGLGNPGWHGNAKEWATKAPPSKVNQSPAVGSIAQWNRNHVAYVEKVSSSYIEVTDDNFKFKNLAGNYTDRFRIARHSPAMPDNFIHLKDVKPPSPKPKPVTAADSIGMYFPWDHSMHLRNSLSSGPSDYAFSYGTSSGGVEGIPLVGDWNGR